jgi:hypothetical protein
MSSTVLLKSYDFQNNYNRSETMCKNFYAWRPVPNLFSCLFQELVASQKGLSSMTE